jgi:hypothetical protein
VPKRFDHDSGIPVTKPQLQHFHANERRIQKSTIFNAGSRQPESLQNRHQQWPANVATANQVGGAPA